MLVEELEKSLNSQELNSIYVLYGEEKFLLESVVKKIKKKFGECINGINYINIDETNINELISDIQTPAFGYPKKLIIVKNSEILKKNYIFEPDFVGFIRCLTREKEREGVKSQ